MSEITVRVLSEDEWEQYREFRLKSLRDSPDAFVADYETEHDFDEKLWRARMRRSVRLLAERDDEPVGIASLRDNDDLVEGAAELFGLWVEPDLRGSGVAEKILLAASDAAEQHGRSQLIYWVGTDNARAVAFASSYGLRPTEYRREHDNVDGEPDEELAMVLALRRR